MNACYRHPKRPVVGQSTLCEACLQRYRELNRASYRRKHGIPLDAPLLRHGRPREKNQPTAAA